MRQYVLPDSFNNESTFVLKNENYHYICNVLRKKVGDSFQGLDNKGNSWFLKISSVKDGNCTLEVKSIKTDKSEKIEITLFQCLPKGKKMDLIIRQAIESGVKRIVPVLSDFAVPQFDNPKDIEKKRLRWEKIATEAMQQSGTTLIPEIGTPISMAEILRIEKNETIGLFFHQIKIDDNSLHKCLNEKVKQVYIVIGPEGGLSDREVEILKKANFQSIYLGGNVLRAETAALYATAAVNVILMEKSKWNLNLPKTE